MGVLDPSIEKEDYHGISQEVYERSPIVFSEVPNSATVNKGIGRV